MIKAARLLIVTLIAVVFAGIVLYVVNPSARAADNGVLLTGTVKSATGGPMAGVTVSAKADGTTIATSVYTDPEGNFYFPRLAEGQYRVWAQAKGYDGGRVSIQMAGPVGRQNFTLKTVEDFSKQLSGDEWMASMPDDTKEDQRMKEVLRLNCVGCHSPAFPLQNRFDEKGWEAILTLMSTKPSAGGCYYTDCNPGGTGDDQPRMAVVSYFKTELATYLAKVRGPEAFPTKLHPRQRPSGEAAMAVVTEYDVPLIDGSGHPIEDGSDWSFGTPGHSGGVHDAQMDYDGNIYFTNWSATKVRTVGRVDGKTGEVTAIKVPVSKGFVASSHAIVRDQNGIMWFNVRDNSSPNMFNATVGEGTNTGRLARLDPKTGRFNIFTPPPNVVAVGSFVDWDGKGNIWIGGGGGSGLVHFDTTTHTFTETKATEGSDNGDIGLFYGVTGDKDGNGWGSQISADMEARVDTETGKMLEVKLPRRAGKTDLFTDTERKVFAMQGQNEFYWGAPWGVGPRRPGADKNGDFVWVPGWWSHTLLKIDIHTDKVVGEYPMPTRDAGPYMAQVDRDHVVWIDYQNSGTITKFDPKTEKWTEYSLPSLGHETHQIGVFDHDGPTQIVLADARNSKIDKVQFRTQSDLNALKAEVNQQQSVSK